METSLRARKKLATHDAIFAAATRLCVKKGYTKTTLSDIADTANVSQRTIFSYFPSKEDIVLEPYKQRFAELVEHLETRGEQTVFDALRALGNHDENNHDDDACRQLIESTPELQEHLASLLSDFEHTLVRLIAEERNLPLDSIQAYMIAAACRALVTYSMDNRDRHHDTAETALRFIEAGLEATS